MRKSICIISYSDIANDARVLRQIQYLSPLYDLTIIGYGKPHEDYLPGDTINWIEVPRGKKSVKRKLSDLFRIFRYAVGLVDRPSVLQEAILCKADLYHANNWESLPVAAKAAQANNAFLFLDIHESLSTSNGKIYNWLNRIVVKKYTKVIDACSTVVQAIADSYKIAFDLEPIVLMNIPSFDARHAVEKPIDSRKIQLIHHGIASPLRCTDLMIKVISLCDKKFELHFALINLESDYTMQLRELAKQIAPGRVFFHPAYPALKIVEEIKKYDIGFFPLPPTSYNYMIALPNKFFEFIAAGLAVCIGPSPSMSMILEQYNCGVISQTFEPTDLASLLNRTTDAEWNKMKIASVEAAKVLNANIEMKKLLNKYEELFKESIEK